MFARRRARTSARDSPPSRSSPRCSRSCPPTPAIAAVPATESDDVGMLDGLVRTIEVVGDRVWVGGTFTQMRNPNGTPARTVSNLAVFDAVTGAPDLTITIPEITRSPGVAVVYDLALGPDGLLYIGGAFDHVGGVVRRNVAAIDPDRRLGRAVLAGHVDRAGACCRPPARSTSARRTC